MDLQTLLIRHKQLNLSAINNEIVLLCPKCDVDDNMVEDIEKFGFEETSYQGEKTAIYKIIEI